MRIQVLLATVAIAMGGISAHAQSADPCAVYTCMAGMSGVGATGGPACTPATAFFLHIVVFDPYYDAAATSLARRQYLMTCPGANVGTNAALLNAIIAEWGTVP